MAETTTEHPVRVLKHDLTRRLLLKIFRGELVGGDRLVEAALASEFKVSRTPVREALLSLSAIGLIELRPNCGAVMRPFGLRQIEEIYDVREILEVEAARRACGRIAPVVIQELKEVFHELKVRRPYNVAWERDEWVADCRLHALVVNHCGNTRLAEELASYGELIQIVRETVGNRRHMQVQAIDEHIAILDGLLQTNPTAAADAMRKHIRSAAALALEALER
ncbi:MAG TPA: GntR family transcriptional regulator [Planctomycetota bacterium]|nr:GntR family transcriptional regulator [Planctomycetota bacterium]